MRGNKGGSALYIAGQSSFSFNRSAAAIMFYNDKILIAAVSDIFLFKKVLNGSKWHQ